MYLKALMVIFNIAKKEEAINSEQYLLGKGKYQIPEGKNIIGKYKIAKNIKE